MLTDGIVRLRLWQVSDAEWYAGTVSGDRLIQRFTSEPPVLTGEEVRSAIADLPERPDAAGFVICDALTGERLGNIALHHHDGVGEVSYWLDAGARGRGAAARALCLLAGWAFEKLALAELTLWTHVDNHSSRRVAERAGFERDPDRDQPRQVKETSWETVAYRRLRRPPETR